MQYWIFFGPMKKFIAGAVLILTVVAACNKGDGGEPAVTAPANCRLASLTFSTGAADSSVYSFQYTGSALTGIILKQGSTTTTRTFQRVGNTILVKPNGSTITDSVFLNDEGLILRHRYRQFIANGLEEITDYAYAGAEVYRRVLTRYQNNAPTQADTTYYQWSRGNLQREIAGGVTTEYAYDTDRVIPAAGVDFFQLRTLLLQGAPVVKNQHFVSVIESPAGSTGSIVSYEFDAEGKVTKMYGAEGIYRFGYTCN